MYYFTVASLPSLTYQSQPTLSDVDYLQYLQEKLTPKEFALVDACRLIPKESSKANHILREWISFERSLRLYLAVQRAQKRQWEFNGSYQPTANLEDKAREAVSKGNPLEAESYLNELRWEFLENLETGHYFDLEYLQIYYLKLQILNRKTLFEPKMGRMNFEGTYNEIRNNMDIEI